MTATKLTPTDVLINLISSFLTPLFLMASNGDIHLAEVAALQTIDAYRVRHQADMMTGAQIVAFGFATLGSLGLSMNDDLSLSMILRLRGNANACNRSAEQLRRALRESQEAQPPAAAPREHPRPAAPQAPPPTEAPAPAQPRAAAPMTPDQQRRTAWAAAFTEVAADYAAERPNLPPEEQRAASIRAAALNSSASALLSGVPLSQAAPSPSQTRPDQSQRQASALNTYQFRPDVVDGVGFGVMKTRSWVDRVDGWVGSSMRRRASA